MATIKEYREFFLRNVQVNSGTKADQELGFALMYLVNGVSRFNRFLKGNFPSENVMKKFTTSITFKLNQEDTAKLTEQGLSVTATDTNAESRTSSNPSTDFTATILPHQLPEIVLSTDGSDAVIGTPSIKNGLKLSILRRTLSGLFRKNFKLEVSPDMSIVIDSGGTEKIQLDGDVANPGVNQYYGTDLGGAKSFFSLDDKINAVRTSTDFNTPFALGIASNVDVTGAVATITIDGKYFISYEADVSFTSEGLYSIVYRLNKTGGIAINDDRVVLVQLPAMPDYIFGQKIVCTAVANLVAGDTVILNADSTKDINISGRSISAIKIN